MGLQTNSDLTPDFFRTCFAAVAVCTLSVKLWAHRSQSRKSADATASAGARAATNSGTLERRYLVAYLLAMFADWLQGPYVYALYAAYGFDRQTNGILFVCGFGSSMVFGTVVGSLADKYGRKRFTLLYCGLYSLACLSKHFASFWVLLAGRVAGGVSTSLLFSVFDSWLCGEHAKTKGSVSLSGIFAKAQFGNSVVAVLAGLVAQYICDLAPMQLVLDGGKHGLIASVFVGGFTLPFDLAMVALMAAALAVAALWDENYGGTGETKDKKKKKEAGSGSGSGSGQLGGGRTVWQDGRLCRLLVACACFEASMYIFVFMWTPALGGSDLPFGMMFATYMMSCMLGSLLFAWTSSLKACLVLATVAHSVVLVAESARTKYLAFLLFEVAVGMYFPAAGTTKARLVPDRLRASIYSLFRVPLNVIVVGTLLGGLGVTAAFFLTTALLATATLASLADFD